MSLTLRRARIVRTFMRMYIEVGTCIWAFTYQEFPALIATALLAIYHFGALVRRLFEQRSCRPLQNAKYLLPGSLLVLSIGHWLNEATTVGAALFAIGAFVPESAFIQENPSEKPARLTKIYAKLLGMTTPFLLQFSVPAYSAIGVLLALLLASTPINFTQNEHRVPFAWNSVDLTNIFHQAGYFAFCFAFWSLLPHVYAYEIAFFFPIGWIAYWILELKLSSDLNFRWQLLIGGHFAFGATLLAMAFMSGNSLAILTGWFLTGLFGGTCYTMDHAPGGRPSELSDDLGALLGSCTGALAIAATGHSFAALVLGCGFACAAALAMIHIRATQTQEGMQR